MRRQSFPGLCAVAAVAAAIASCGGGNDNGAATPGDLVSTCDMICANVVAQCPPASGGYGACLGACNDLNILRSSCLDPFLSYLTCISGATSVQCDQNGQYVLVTPSQCVSDRQATLTCNATPGLVSACVALPGNNACAQPGAPGGNPLFCVGPPQGCPAASQNPLGIGIYCCR